MDNILTIFKIMIIVSIVYSLGMTLIAYSLPADSISYPDMFKESLTNADIDDISTSLEDSMQLQTNVPVIDIGTLVFYTGNFLLDLLLNFITAVPQMFGLLITGLGILINADPFMITRIQVALTALWLAMYVIGIIQFITGLRSGSNLV